MKILLWLVGGLLGVVVLAVLALLLVGRRPGAGDTHNEIEIARPPDVVWAWITEPDSVKQWVSWTVDVRQETPGVVGVGARETWVMDDPNMKKRIELPSEVIAWDPPRSVTVKLGMPGAFDGTTTYTVTPTAAGTHVAMDGRWKYTDPFARLLEPLVTQQAVAKGDADFATLKRLAEAR